MNSTLNAFEAHEHINGANWVTLGGVRVVGSTNWLALQVESVRIYNQSSQSGIWVCYDIDLMPYSAHITLRQWRRALDDVEINLMLNHAFGVLRQQKLSRDKMVFYRQENIPTQEMPVLTTQIQCQCGLHRWIRDFARDLQYPDFSEDKEYHLSLRNRRDLTRPRPLMRSCWTVRCPLSELPS